MIHKAKPPREGEAYHEPFTDRNPWLTPLPLGPRVHAAVLPNRTPGCYTRWRTTVFFIPMRWSTERCCREFDTHVAPARNTISVLRSAVGWHGLGIKLPFSPSSIPAFASAFTALFLSRVRAKSHSSRTRLASYSASRERTLRSSMFSVSVPETFECGRPQIVFERGIGIVVVIEPKLCRKFRVGVPPQAGLISIFQKSRFSSTQKFVDLQTTRSPTAWQDYSRASSLGLIAGGEVAGPSTHSLTCNGEGCSADVQCQMARKLIGFDPERLRGSNQDRGTTHGEPQ